MEYVSRQHIRVALLVIGLSLAAYAACGQAADAQPLPAGTVIERPDGERVKLDVTHFLITRDQLDRANATAATAKRLEIMLGEVTQRALELSKPEAGWKVAARWTSIGTAIGAAFVAGLLLR